MASRRAELTGSSVVFPGISLDLLWAVEHTDCSRHRQQLTIVSPNRTRVAASRSTSRLDITTSTGHTGCFREKGPRRKLRCLSVSKTAECFSTKSFRCIRDVVLVLETAMFHDSADLHRHFKTPNTNDTVFAKLQLASQHGNACLRKCQYRLSTAYSFISAMPWPGAVHSAFCTTCLIMQSVQV